MSVFIDESGDFGFVGDASKYYVVTFVFHDQQYDISSNIERIKDKPVFHAGPIIRREYPFENDSPEDRKKLLHSIFMFTLSLPIKIKTFYYSKKDFNSDVLKMQAKMSKDLYNFFLDNREMFSEYKLKIYAEPGKVPNIPGIRTEETFNGTRYIIYEQTSSRNDIFKAQDIARGLIEQYGYKE